MKNFLTLSIALLVLGFHRPLIARDGPDQAFKAGTPEIAVSTYYLAIAKRDIGLISAVDSDPKWASQEVLAKMSTSIVGFRVVAKGPMKKGMGVKEGDAYVRTEEFFAGVNKSGHRHFHLRKIGGAWAIINFNVDRE
jgi:hypothetical protein